jgi:hypothetical protein
MYICCSLLLHVSAAHGPSSGNTHYFGRPLHCALVHFVFCTYRHIVVIVLNLFYRIFYPIFVSSRFSVPL